MQLTLIFPGPGVLVYFTHNWKKQQKPLEAREGTKAAPESCSPCWLYVACSGNWRWLVHWLIFFIAEVTANNFCTHIMLKWRDWESGSQTQNYMLPGSPNSLGRPASFPFCHKTPFHQDTTKPDTSWAHCLSHYFTITSLFAHAPYIFHSSYTATVSTQRLKLAQL